MSPRYRLEKEEVVAFEDKLHSSKQKKEQFLQTRIRVTEIRVKDVVVSELSAINQVKFPFNLIKALK